MMDTFFFFFWHSTTSRPSRQPLQTNLDKKTHQAIILIALISLFFFSIFLDGAQQVVPYAMDQPYVENQKKNTKKNGGRW